jgi:K+-transporting ATPase ATPase A chain
MQWVAVICIAQILLPLLFTAIASFVYIHYPGGNATLGWLSNPGPHGFTTMLYEYVSSYAGNGSDFAGLGNNTAFWNTTTGIVMLAGRFLPIAGSIAIAGLLERKTYAPPSSGSLKTTGITFGSLLLMLIIIVNALSLFIVYMSGPITEHFSR